MNFKFETGRLWHETDGQADAEILFSVINDGKTWSIDSTLLAAELRGQGVAGKMLADLVAKAREANVTLKPVCSYAWKKFFETPEYQEIQYHED